MKSRLVLALLLIALAPGATAIPHETEFCTETSEDLSDSCREGANSDLFLALAKCENLSDPAARKACRRQAQADNRSALRTCNNQFSARQAICKRVGERPYDPVINPANFTNKIDNPFFPLPPGTTFVFEGMTSEGLEHNEVEVTQDTRTILGVTCVVVHDVVTVNGELTEDTLDFFAQDKAGNVWSFGENTKEVADGLVVSLKGTFTAGVDGAKPGIVMGAHPFVGEFHRQEFSLGVAEDVAEVISLNNSVTVPAGSFTGVVRTRETTPLEPDMRESKFFASGVGNVRTIDETTGDTFDLIAIRKR